MCGALPPPRARQDAKAGAPPACDGAALHDWVAHRVGAYAAALRAHLPNITEGGALASVLEHATYCGGSLARVGLDFRVRAGWRVLELPSRLSPRRAAREQQH